ncbi:histone-lysine N-methyltransferase SETMAR [Trichonephila clavipes]|nr:histone-lysine N-methyltransferase SETMAR [Trichonephila clavipes]
MGKRGDISPCKKAEVKALVTGKLFSNREISRRLKVSEASVRRIKKKIESGEELSLKRKKECGRKPFYTPSDESTFEILQNKAQFVRRRRGEKFHSDCVVQTVKHPTKIMIWSVISSKGILYQHAVEPGTTINDSYYTNVLRTLVQQVKRKHPLLRNGSLLHHDNARPHIARCVLYVSQKNNGEILPDPSYSPNLTPCDFWLFPQLNKPLRGKRFTNSKACVKAAKKNPVLKTPVRENTTYFKEILQEKWRKRLKLQRRKEKTEAPSG